jgi:hypothetical protein
MATRQVQVERFSVTSSKAFQEVVAAIENAIRHPDMNAFRKNVAAAKTYGELEKIVHGATGPSELMEFTRMDLGEVLRKGSGAAARQSLRFVVGNPVIMSHGSACAGCRLVRASDHSHRRAPRRSSPFLRQDGELSRPVRKPRSSESC